VVRTAEFEEKYLLFGVNEGDSEMTESLRLIALDRIDIIPVVDRAGKWRVFGKLTKAERDTLEAVCRSKKNYSNAAYRAAEPAEQRCQQSPSATLFTSTDPSP